MANRRPLERMERYVSDFLYFSRNQYPICRFEELVLNPKDTLRNLCERVGIRYQESMITWPKPERKILDRKWGNISGSPFDRAKALCECRFGPSMLDYLQTEFEFFFKANRYPILSTPGNDRYALDSAGHLILDK